MAETENRSPKASSMKELWQAYKVSRRTFKRWLIKIPDLGDYDGKAYTPAQVQKIYNHLGTP